MLLLTVALSFAVSAEATADVDDVFHNPPKSAMTGVWWHWMGSYISKEGIVKDLDYFKRSGIGAATIFSIADVCVPWASEIKDPPGGKVLGFTDKWWSFVRFACDEAEKRGIEIGLHNCPGYTSTGGPWITPDLAMRQLVFNVTNVEKQISLVADALFPVENGDTGAFEKPDIPSRRTDLREIAVVEGVKVQHIPMGAYTQPNQWEMFGLECDKMSPRAVSFHLDHVIGMMKKHLGRHVGSTFKFVLLDSYEAGQPTWTENFREEFKARRGYDPLPYLPLLGGFKVSAARSDAAEKKFISDYEQTRKDLFRDVLFKIMREKLAAHGLSFVCEPYEGPFDSRECARYVDRVMTEFWFDPNVSEDPLPPLGWNKWIGPCGARHNIIEAEAFTSGPPLCMWTETPCTLKAAADAQFVRGVNRMVLHTCPLQPWGDDVKPGKTMGRWGTHFGRNQTWAESGKGFFDYLNRSQALLQWGEFCDDKLQVSSCRPATAKISSLCRSGRGKKVFFVVNHSKRPAEVTLNLPEKAAAARWLNSVSGKIEPMEVKNGKVDISFPPRGSGFLEVGKIPFKGDSCGKGKSFASINVSRPYKVTFDGVKIEMDKLEDWTKSKDRRVKYFSGTAIYETSFAFAGSLAQKFRVRLGECNQQIAKVVVNGVDCGTVWCEPYEVEVPRGVMKKGENALVVEFTNVWANRLIGDEFEARDAEYVKAPFPGGEYLLRAPSWLPEGIKARPSRGRKAFTDWNYFTKDSPLVPSGLLGPVEIATANASKIPSPR